MAQTVKNLPAMKETWGTPVFLPGESHGQRSLAGYSPWCRRVGHDWVTNIFTFIQKDGVSQVALMVQNPLANAGDIKDAGPCIRKIPRRRKWHSGVDGQNPMDRGAWQAIQSMGSQRAGHDWSNLTCMHTHRKRAISLELAKNRYFALLILLQILASISLIPIISYFLLFMFTSVTIFLR